MKRLISMILLATCLLTGLIQPVFGTDGEPPEPTEAFATQTEPTETLATQAEPTETLVMPTEPTEESLAETTENAAPEEPSEAPLNRAPDAMRVSEEGIAFIDEMMGGSYGGTNQLAGAESAVNDFISRYSLTLNQQQFDALADFVMAYGTDKLSGGYRIETVIAGGTYTDAELASSFCAWVKGSDGNFSQTNLNRRLREVKLFLYGSYSGVCAAAFRYVVFYPNGGSMGDNNTVVCYMLDSTYDALPVISRSLFYFAGWYTAASGGTHLCNTDTVTENRTVYAHWSNSPVTNPNEPNSEDEEPLIPPELKTSEAGVQFIKDHEGFAKYPMWDYAQYSVGYGSRCPDDKLEEYRENGITEEEADYLLRVMLADFEVRVDALLERSGKTYSQEQYDAIISFTYNLGQQWMNENYTIYQYIIYGGYTEMQLVNTFGSWCNAGGQPLVGLQRRRMDEANLYLNGDYTLSSRTYLCFNFNGASGTPEYGFHYYKAGEPIGTLPTATREGYKFLGWYDRVVGGNGYTVGMTAPSYGVYTLYAQWEQTEDLTGPTFSDVSEDAWYYGEVTRAVQEGLFRGISETQFAPENKMTRAMLVTVLYRYDGEQKAGTNSFTDVPDGEWYTDAVAWAAENNIVKGIGGGKFDPEGNVTREQLVTILHRYCGEPDPGETGTFDTFLDAGSVNDYAKAAMQWAVARGILNGSDGKLMPLGEATRAEVAAIMVRFSQME